MRSQLAWMVMQEVIILKKSWEQREEIGLQGNTSKAKGFKVRV
jgi:hypothetical protein